MLFFIFDRGRAGEAAARVYLRGRGLNIIESNFRTPYGEIDIIAQDGSRLIFVEVKTRRRVDGRCFSAWDDISEKKLARIERAARIYVRRNRRRLMSRRVRSCRIDGLVIEDSKSQPASFEYRSGLGPTIPLSWAPARGA